MLLSEFSPRDCLVQSTTCAALKLNASRRFRKVGTSLVRFTPARTEPTLYAGSMATNVAVTAKGLVKQWDFSAIGRADFELKDWESEYDYPRTPYGSTFNTVNIAGGLGARDAGVISWYFDTSSVYLLRIDGESSKANASLLAPTWVITLAEGLESPSSYGPSFAVLGPRLAVLDSTNNESVALRVYSAATGKPEWHTEVKLPSAPGKSARAQFSAAWDGNLACTLASVDVFGASQSVSEWPSNASTRPPGRGSNERRGAAAPPPPNPLSELACYDVEASTRLWTVPVHHRPFHPLDGWEQGEFAGTMVVTSKGVLVRCLKYIWNKETKNWNSQSTHIRAYDISGNLHWTIPVDNTFIAAAQVTGAFFRGGGDLGDAIELLTV